MKNGSVLQSEKMVSIVLFLSTFCRFASNASEPSSGGPLPALALLQQALRAEVATDVLELLAHAAHAVVQRRPVGVLPLRGPGMPGSSRIGQLRNASGAEFSSSRRPIRLNTIQTAKNTPKHYQLEDA